MEKFAPVPARIAGAAGRHPDREYAVVENGQVLEWTVKR
jgi:hypothetical protein